MTDHESLLDDLRAERDHLRGQLAHKVESTAQLLADYEATRAINMQLRSDAMEHNAAYQRLMDDYKATAAINVRLQGEVDRLRDWLKKHGHHDESRGKCYGRKYPHPDPDKSEFTCQCGLMDLIAGVAPGSAQQAPQAPIAKITVRESGAGHYAPDDVYVSLYAPGLPPGEFDVYLDPSAPGITGNAQRALCPKGHTEQDGDCSSTCFVPHEHRWSKPHDCGDPACEATGRVICLTGDSRCIPPGADPHE